MLVRLTEIDDPVLYQQMRNYEKLRPSIAQAYRFGRQVRHLEDYVPLTTKYTRVDVRISWYVFKNQFEDYDRHMVELAYRDGYYSLHPMNSI